MPSSSVAFKDLDHLTQKEKVLKIVKEIETEIADTKSRKKKVWIEGKKEFETEFIINSRVIFTTLMTGGGARLAGLSKNVEYLIIDEAC